MSSKQTHDKEVGPIRKVAPSVMAREELDQLLAGGVDEGANLISEVVATCTRLVIQSLVEAEQRDFLGGRGRYQPREDEAGHRGWRNGYEDRNISTAEGQVGVRVPQVRDAGEPFRSTLMGFLEGNSEVLERLVMEMYARGLSTRDVEDAFRDATGELVISRSAVSEVTDRLWDQCEQFCGDQLGRPQASAPLGGGQQGIREGPLDRVLLAHDPPGATATYLGDLRRGAGADQSAQQGIRFLYPGAVLVPPPRQHPGQAPRRGGSPGDGRDPSDQRRPHP